MSNIYKTYEHLDTAQKTNWKKENTYGGYRHRNTYKSRRRRNPNIYETCEDLNATRKTEAGKGQIYDGYGHRCTKQIQKTQ